MKRVHVTAKLLAPVAIKRDRQSERSESVRSISGTLVRGALASIYLQQRDVVDDTFKDLFLNEASCRFGPLDPGPKHFPLTAASCKREDIKHALVDRLWYRAAQHHRDGNLQEDAEITWRQCKKCESDLEGHHGFWIDANDKLREESRDRHYVAAHVGIDRHTNTAVESIFYTLEALLPSGEEKDSSEEKDLSGWIVAGDEALKNLKELLDPEDYCISVGHHRTRGYGDIRLELNDSMDTDDPASHVENWEKWSSELIDFLTEPQLSIPNLNSENFYFSLSFPTGAVLVDNFLRYTIDPANMVPWIAPMPSVDTAFPMKDRPLHQLSSGGTVQWITAVTKHERLRGWNASHGLPRQDEWMVARGSVYVYCFQGTLEEREALIQQLATLSEEGVGLRRNEGFGTVIVSDDFHCRFCKQ